ncbi:MAG: hypothetical protein KAT25_10555 [Sulfuriflexus sp.]|nr:hypothetical protein [Sulfuriflexus sp.]
MGTDILAESDRRTSRRRDVGLVVKLSLTITFVVSFAVLLTAFLTYFNFNKAYSDITQARHLVLGGNLKKSIEYSLNVGVNIDELRNTQTLIDELAKKNTDIDVLRVLTTNSQILYDKDKTASTTESLLDVGHGQPVAGSDYRIVESNDVIILLIPIYNNFSAQVGLLQIGYSNEKTNAYLWETKLFLLQHSILSISMIAIMVLILVYFITKKFRSRLEDMGSALTNLMKDSHHDPDEIKQRGNFENAYLVFHEKTQELLLSFDAASKDLDKLEKKNIDV